MPVPTNCARPDSMRRPGACLSPQPRTILATAVAPSSVQGCRIVVRGGVSSFFA